MYRRRGKSTREIKRRGYKYKRISKSTREGDKRMGEEVKVQKIK